MKDKGFNLAVKKIYCHNCGKENLSTNKFCTACGTKLDKSTKNNNSSKEEAKAISNTMVFSIIGGVLVLAVIILYFSGTFDKPNFVPNNNQTNRNSQNFSNTPDLNSIQQISALEKQFESNPNDYDTLLRLAHLLNDSRFYERAIKEYTKYLKKYPKKADVWVDMGVCYYQLRKHAKAIEIMKKAIAINPKHQIANFNLGIVNYDAGNKAKAMAWWKKAVAIDPSSRIGQKAKSLINQNNK